MIYLLFLVIFVIIALILYEAYLLARLEVERLVIANRALKRQNKTFMDICNSQQTRLLRLQASHREIAKQLNDLRLSLMASPDTQPNAQQQIVVLPGEENE